jgi:T-complex protein 1 subunit beta
MLGSGTATQGILNQGATEEKGEIARLASFVGAMAVSDLVKTTLGPKGMDKILLSTVRTSLPLSAPLRPLRTADTVC